MENGLIIFIFIDLFSGFCFFMGGGGDSKKTYTKGGLGKKEGG